MTSFTFKFWFWNWIYKRRVEFPSWLPYSGAFAGKGSSSILMGTPIRPQLLSSSKKTKASYVMISKFPNIRSTFPIQISNSFQFLSPDFPPLQPSKSFIQASKSTPKNIVVQRQSSLTLFQHYLLLLSLLLLHFLIVNMSKNSKP